MKMCYDILVFKSLREVALELPPLHLRAIDPYEEKPDIYVKSNKQFYVIEL